MPARPRHTEFNRINVLVLALIAAGTVLELYRAGYLPLVTWPFAIYGGVVFGLAVWFAAFELTTRRFLWLALVAGATGYLTQVVGSTEQGAWHYAFPRDFGFVRGMFVLAAVLAYGATVSLLAPLVRHVLPVHTRWFNVLLVVALFAGFVLLGRADRAHTGSPWVWVYYVGLTLVALYVAALTNPATLVGLVVAAAAVGYASETLGAHSGLWTFTRTGTQPPLYLVLASWPLEIVFHYGVSGLLAGESLVARRRLFREPVLFREFPEHAMHCGDGPLPVVVREGDDKHAVLDEVLDATRFFEVLDARAAALGVALADLHIAIKPNFMFMYSPEDRSTFTDPALVEQLVDRLRAHGCRNIDVVEAQSAYGNFFHGREVPRVAAVVGYRPADRYRIVDLTADQVPHTYRGPLGEHAVGRAWRDAQFRISFAKNKTHSWAWYTLCLKNIYGTLPAQDKIREYHHRREIYYPTIDALIEFPVHFGMIDAYLSADGPFGIFADREPNATRTIIGGPNIVAVDWVGAGKMGLDPMVSRYMQLAVQVFGKPHVAVDGSQAVYQPWCNVPKEVTDLWDHAEENYAFTNTVFALLNRHYVSDHFAPKRMNPLLRVLAALFFPLGGIVYKPKRSRP
jgi:uncharacterized protein (DUF362 family)